MLRFFLEKSPICVGLFCKRDLFVRALLPKSPCDLGSLPLVATPYLVGKIGRKERRRCMGCKNKEMEREKET